jgi:2,4-dienoyl-CoA reductase-like NADH-dependent reductase (Old Yellow Enzyme family)
VASLFDALTLRGLTINNRAWVSPMCQYSSVDGFAQPWHMVHLGAFAVGRAGLVMSEATAVTPEGRISPEDLGLWSDAHAEALAPAAKFVRAQGAAFGVQLAHAGRKASTFSPWRGSDSVPVAQGGWETLAPSAAAFGRFNTPLEMTGDDLLATRQAFADAATRADQIGADTVEIHAAHGYLLHEFLSPLSNTRTDSYGGTLDNRLRYPLEVVEAVRSVWPDSKPLLLRVSATDWVDGGLTVDDTVELARRAKELGVDLVDASSGGLDPAQQIAIGAGYQVPFAERIRREAGIATAAVGLITDGRQADQIIGSGAADAVMIGRAMLRDPRWALRAAADLGVEIAWPNQYTRALG